MGIISVGRSIYEDKIIPQGKKVIKVHGSIFEWK
jgi:hypothetical protein